MPYKEFKRTVRRMLPKLENRGTEGKLQQRESIRKNQTDLKDTITNIKKSTDYLTQNKSERPGSQSPETNQ